MQTSIARSLSFLCITLVAGFSRAEEPLRWKFKSGETLHYEMMQNMESSAEAGPAGNIKTGMLQTLHMTWHIDEVTPEGDAKMRQKIDRVQMKMTMPGGQVSEYDSAKDEAPQGVMAMIAPLFQAMTEGEFKLTMTSQGKITDVEPPTDMVEAMKKIPGAAAMGNIASADGLKQMITQGSMELPAGDLTKGESWNTTMDMDSPAGKQIITTTYEYVGPRVEDGNQLEVFKPSIEIETAPGENALVQMSMKDQSSEGEILFNREAGRLQSTHLQQKLNMEMKVQGQTINNIIEQTVDMKFKPAESSDGKKE